MKIETYKCDICKEKMEEQKGINIYIRASACGISINPSNKIINVCEKCMGKLDFKVEGATMTTIEDIIRDIFYGEML